VCAHGFEDSLRRGLIDDTVMHQRVTRVAPHDNVANCTQWRACSRSLCFFRKNSSAIRSWGEEKAFIDRLSSLGSVLLFPSPIPLKAELIKDGRAYAKKNGTAVEPLIFCSRILQTPILRSYDSPFFNDTNEAAICHYLRPPRMQMEC